MVQYLGTFCGPLLFHTLLRPNFLLETYLEVVRPEGSTRGPFCCGCFLIGKCILVVT
uniref:Uncharacterized protein n=1 Tax=Arundo donax TaxID=35708 RepID=A0A0A9A5A5_ARUDO